MVRCTTALAQIAPLLTALALLAAGCAPNTPSDDPSSRTCALNETLCLDGNTLLQCGGDSTFVALDCRLDQACAETSPGSGSFHCIEQRLPCTSGVSRCLDTTHLQYCGTNNIFVNTTCSPGQRCGQTSSGRSACIGQATGPACQSGESRCQDATTLLSCGNTNTFTTVVCTGGDTCRETSAGSGAFACAPRPPASEGEACDFSPGACQPGLDCLMSFVGGQGSCLRSCTSAIDCSSGEYCDMSALFNTNGGACLPVAARGGLCFFDDAGCQDGLLCLWSGVGYVLTCEEACDIASEGSRGSCSNADDLCLRGFDLEPQRSASGASVPCAQVGRVDTCGGAEGYRCFIDNQAAQTSSCARNRGVCGNGLAADTRFASTDLAAHAQAVAAGTSPSCGVPGSAELCAPAATGDSQTECANSWYPLTSDIACVDDLDCMLDGMACIAIDSGTSRCGLYSNVCVHYCEDVAGEAQFTCPSGLVCAEPRALVGYPVLQSNSAGGAQICLSNAGCDLSAGFVCQLFGDGNSYCVRNRKLCRDDCAAGHFGIRCAPCPSCSGHGSCADGVAGDGACGCDSGWLGAECQLPCPTDAMGDICGTHGSCALSGDGLTAECLCGGNFVGSACDSCPPSYFGANCDPCPSGADGGTCSGHGSCSDGISGSGLCSCDAGWGGLDCGTML